MSLDTVVSFTAPGASSIIAPPKAPGHSRSQPLLLVALLALIGVCTLAPATARAQSVEWTQRMVNAPAPRYYPAIAYDAARAVTVLFGGYAVTFLDETWEWNGSAWTRRMVAGPSPRYYPSMAYDSARGVTVLFGGQTSSGLSGETWEWNGSAWTQRMVSGPAPRYYHAMAYDAARAVTVLFGGYPDGHDGETWEWNGSAWTRRMVSGPPPRYGHAMAYDAARAVTVLFGGDANGETWEWNGSAWTRRTQTGPSPRVSPAMAFDSDRAVTVLFGGYMAAYNADTWEWDGTAWMRRAAGGPAPRYCAATAYDASRAVTVLFGGVPYGGINGETWELNVSLTIAVQPTTQITCRTGAASFSVTPAGSGSFTYRWRFRGEPINTTLNPSAATAMLTLSGVTAADAGAYDCIVSSACCSATSNTATLTVCSGDYNCDGGVDGADVNAFFADWESGNPAADVNADGGVDGSDVEFFFSHWEAGC